jgi:hypothetical protein
MFRASIDGLGMVPSPHQCRGAMGMVLKIEKDTWTNRVMKGTRRTWIEMAESPYFFAISGWDMLG